MEKKHATVLWTAILATTAVAAAMMLPVIPQDPEYHNFADTRIFLGIPNTLDVLSNIPLIVLGVAGIVLCRRKDGPHPIADPGRLKIILFATVMLTGLGSFLYHWLPDNASILWDRLPLSVMFPVVYLIILADRVSPRIASKLAPFALAAGPLSVFYWYWSELQGSGDLRFYGIVQLLPLLLVPATIILSPQGGIKNAVLWKAFAWYAPAKLAESLDVQIYQWTGFVSGHTLKHLCAGVAVYCLLSICRVNTGASRGHVQRL